jgi:hypothetical protein
MKNYIICAGGSGVRALESMLHLCAAGLGPDEVKVLVIDPDASNGNYSRTNDVFTDFRDCCDSYRGKLGNERFFATKLTSLAGENGGGLQAWSPVNKGQFFHEVLGGNLTHRQKDVANLMFTEAEMNMKLNVGFKGHPALGAAALALLSLYGVKTDPQADPVWLAVGAQLTKDLSNGPVRVVIVGSVFGGTGASVFFPLARRLRELAGTMKENLKIGVVALAPYFTFPISPEATDDGPDARKFPIATRSAAEFYQHLRSKGQWPFDAMFWLGDDTPAEVHYGEGGEQQKNKAHFIDFFAGLTCLEYFKQAVGTSLEGKCFVAGPDGDEATNQNVTTWKDIPLLSSNREEIGRSLLRFNLAGAMHLGFFSEMLEQPQSDLMRRPTAIPWYFERFVKAKTDKVDPRLNVPPHNSSITSLSKFLRLRHFPWWRDVHTSAEGRVHLFNSNSILHQEGPPATASLDLRRLKNLLHPEASNPDRDAVHRFFNDTFSRRKAKAGASEAADGAPAYLATLAHAADDFISREYPRGVTNG